MKSWFLAARPKTLTASLIPIVAACGLVRSQSLGIQWSLVFCALASSFFIQIATNLINDAVDFKKGADTKDRLGPIRVTQSGLITEKRVYFGAGVCLLMAVAFGLPLVIEGGMPILVLGLISLFMAYGYTGGPFPLAYKGLGDLFVIIFFGLIAVGGMTFILTHHYDLETFVLGLQIGFLNTILIAINNLRDIESDSLAHKKTLAVRLGKFGAKAWIIFLILAPFFLGYYWIFVGKKWLYIVPILAFPLGLSVLKKIIKTEPSVVYNQFLAQSAAYGLIFTVGFYLGSFL
jgi:1,4-dihydroxy-2-naphthoate polyprenyltransferase